MSSFKTCDVADKSLRCHRKRANSYLSCDVCRLQMRYCFFLLALVTVSCTNLDEDDPIAGLMNVFIFDGGTYATPGGAYHLYDKAGDDYYYYFLIGTTDQFQPNKTIADARVVGDFVRILFVGDTLDQFYGEHPIP